MIERYAYKEMQGLWTDEYRYSTWLRVELAIAAAYARYGVIPKDAVKKLQKNAKFSIQRIDEIEKEVQHDVIAFVKAVAENCGDEGKYLHFGVTSYDVVDTALSLRLKESANLLLKEVKALRAALMEKAKEHKNTPMMGRTHGVHAEPVTFGFKMLVWVNEVDRHIERLKEVSPRISAGKISGAVGIYANTDPKIEAFVCKTLELVPSKASTQILQRDRHAEFVNALAVLVSSIEKFATEIRNLQRTEILEAEEFFAAGQRGSSAMPHKKNPIVCERLCGLARIIRGHALAAMENVPLWHERDLTNSAPERIIFPQACVLTHYIVRKFTDVMRKLVVHPGRMLENLHKTQDLFASEKVMHILIDSGFSREESYTFVQKKALESFHTGKNFKKLLLSNKKYGRLLAGKIDRAFDVKQYTKHLSTIYKRFM